MPDIGFMELLVIGIVALIVVGPKDLPMMFRKLGQFTGRLRGMAREFSQAMNDAADDTGMSDITRDLKAASKYTSPRKMAKDLVGDALDGIEKDIDPTQYEEGSATRTIAEKRAAAQAETKRRIAEAKAARAAEMSGEPEEPGGDQPIAPADPGPATVAPEPRTAPAAAPASTPAAAAEPDTAPERT